MAQHDYVIANGTGAAVRSDLNAGFAAIVSQNSGATAPSTTYAYQSWADTTAGVMKMRNGANNAWITLYQLDGEWSTIAFENGTAAAPSIYFKDSGTDTGFYSPGADQVGISTGGTARITVDGSGNVNIDSNTLYVDAANNRVGIGTISPGTTLDVRGNGTFTGNATARQTVDFTNTGGQLYVGVESSAGGAVFTGSSAYAGIVGTNNSTNLQLATNGAVRATLDTSGRVGIGTTSPGSFTPGNLVVEAATTAGITISESTGAGTASIAFSATSSFQNKAKINCTISSQSLEFSTAGTERMRIDSAGNTRFNSASYSPTADPGVKIVSSATIPEVRTVVNTADGGITNYSYFNTNATYNGYRFYVKVDGGVANHSVNNVNLSDRNVKKDISPAADTWDCIKEWEIVNYRYKDQPNTTTLNLGVIAQQVAESCPEVITVFEEAKDDQPEKLGVKEQQMYWMAIKALQEAQARIEALEADVAQLKGA